MTYDTWFVVPVQGESGARLLVKASDKIGALAAVMFQRPELKPGPVETFEQHCSDRALDPADELQYTLGIINPAVIVLGTITLMP